MSKYALAKEVLKSGYEQGKARLTPGIFCATKWIRSQTKAYSKFNVDSRSR